MSECRRFESMLGSLDAPDPDARAVLPFLAHAKDCEECDEQPVRIDVIDRRITLHGDLDTAQRTRLLEIAEKCPVHRTLTGTIRINDRIE